MDEEVKDTLMFEGPAVLEKLSGEMPYKRLVGDVYYISYPPEEELNNHLTVKGGSDYFLDTEQITVDKENETIKFSVYDGDYIIRKIVDEDSEWATEEDLMEAENGNF